MKTIGFAVIAFWGTPAVCKYVIPLILGICWSVSIQEIERIKAVGGVGEKVAVGYILIRQFNEYFK